MLLSFQGVKVLVFPVVQNVSVSKYEFSVCFRRSVNIDMNYKVLIKPTFRFFPQLKSEKVLH